MFNVLFIMHTWHRGIPGNSQTKGHVTKWANMIGLTNDRTFVECPYMKLKASKSSVNALKVHWCFFSAGVGVAAIK